jgi:predicted Zn finger-like uncharacterized protein
MSIATTCPGCSASYQLADTMRGKKVRCKSCSEVFVVRSKTSASDRDEDEERIQTSPRPAKRVAVREEEDEDTERLSPRRRPRKKHSSAALPLIIFGGIAAGVLILGLGGLAIWALTRLRQPEPAPVAVNSNPPMPAAQPVQNPAPQNPAPPQNQVGAPMPPAPPVNPQIPNPAPAQGPLAAELTNGKVSGLGARMQVEVDYRFTSGNPAGKRLVLFIKATKIGGLRQNYYLAELRSIGGQTQGTVRASGLSFGIEHGPFEMWIAEGPPGVGLLLSDRNVKKISNVVTVAFKQNTLPGMRPPIGPRRIRP